MQFLQVNGRNVHTQKPPQDKTITTCKGRRLCAMEIYAELSKILKILEHKRML